MSVLRKGSIFWKGKGEIGAMCESGQGSIVFLKGKWVQPLLNFIPLTIRIYVCIKGVRGKKRRVFLFLHASLFLW